MLQDTQSFSELTDIDTTELLEVNVVLRKHGDIDFTFSVNDDKFSDLMFSKKYPINTLLIFKCQLHDFIENSGAVEVVSISVNGREILPKYQHHGVPASAYFDFSTKWVLQLDRPFYSWYHEITGQGWIA